MIQAVIATTPVRQNTLLGGQRSTDVVGLGLTRLPGGHLPVIMLHPPGLCDHRQDEPLLNAHLTATANAKQLGSLGFGRARLAGRLGTVIEHQQTQQSYQPLAVGVQKTIVA
ncbi:MAG: hypothetical protein PHT20_13115 [Rhodoferax sp.]|nr:hypothetical protein [Rhodoferax sp.]